MNLKKKESNHLQVSLSLFSIIQSLIQICWDVKHVLPLALNASPYFFETNTAVMQLGELRLSKTLAAACAIPWSCAANWVDRGRSLILRFLSKWKSSLPKFDRVWKFQTKCRNTSEFARIMGDAAGERREEEEEGVDVKRLHPGRDKARERSQNRLRL